jgi:transcriptional regulator with XRE-family HTH domain
MKSIHDPRYIAMINKLRDVRKDKKILQQDIIQKLGKPMSYLAKIENFERRLDLVELYDLLEAMDVKMGDFLKDVEWID